ncbi:MAG: dihydrofolate reductase, partial [Zetaproteobacteria bacterium]
HNQLPWHLPADLAWFRKHTLGKPVLMGRKTYESIGHPLPERKNLVLTTDVKLRIPGCTTVHSLAQAFHTCAGQASELMVIGGAEVYRLALPQAQRLYITEVHGRFDGDAWFPSFDRRQWQEVYREDHTPDAKNAWPYSFTILERRSPPQSFSENMHPKVA